MYPRSEHKQHGRGYEMTTKTAHFGKTTIRGKKALVLYNERGDQIAQIVTGYHSPSDLKELLRAFTQAVEGERSAAAFSRLTGEA
jgi:hypothetical protein